MRLCAISVLLLSSMILVDLTAPIACVNEKTPVRADSELDQYVKKPDKSFTWKLVRTRDYAGGKIHDLKLTSQTWHDIVWAHDLLVVVPTGTKPSATLFLWNQGPESSVKGKLLTNTLAIDLATKMKAPVCFLLGVPNQPMLGDRKEDALIAETFVRYLDTKDDSWPLLFPMTKSLVRAMDALQAFARQQWKVEVKQFLVSGASKRGWTTWLTGVVDPRVKAIAPLVFDTLNMQKQLPYQVQSYGRFSEMIRDYTARKLTPPPATPEGDRLWRMVDPWLYRDRLRMPKLILNGTNDPYWTQDALNLYWNDLQGDKWVCYVPNAGHGLAQKKPDGTRDLERAANVLAAFTRAQVLDKPFPKLSWTHIDVSGKPCLTVASDTTPQAVRLWQADAPTRDFRKATWKSSEVRFHKGKATLGVVLPETGCRVFFAEHEFEDDGLRDHLSTQVRIVGKPVVTK